MADAFQQSAALANQMTAAGLPYVQQAADFGTPLARGVQSGMGLAQQQQAMDLDAERLEIQQALAEAQVEENAQRRMDYASELALRQQVAQTRMMEVENQRAELDLSRVAGEETRSYRSLMMMRELQQSGPLDLGGGKHLWAKLGPGGVLSPVEVDEKHPAVVSSRSLSEQQQTLREQQQKALEALTDQRMRGRSGGSDSVRLKALSEAAESLEKSAEAIPVKTGDGSKERKEAMLNKAGMFRSMIEQELGVAGDSDAGAAPVSPAQRALTAARRMAEAKVMRNIPGLGDDPEQFSQKLRGVGMALRASGQGWMDDAGREATDDEMAASIVEALNNPQTSQPDREFLIELIRSFGR